MHARPEIGDIALLRDTTHTYAYSDNVLSSAVNLLLFEHTVLLVAIVVFVKFAHISTDLHYRFMEGQICTFKHVFKSLRFQLPKMLFYLVNQQPKRLKSFEF